MQHSHALRFTAVLLSLCILPVVAQADSATTEQVVAHHLAAFNAGNADGAAADYDDSVVLVTAGGVMKGKAAAHKMLAAMFGGPAHMAPLDVKRKLFSGDVAYIVWVENAGTPGELRGSDTYIVHNGKIVVQTVAAVPMHPRPPAK